MNPTNDLDKYNDLHDWDGTVSGPSPDDLFTLPEAAAVLDVYAARALSAKRTGEYTDLSVIAGLIRKLAEEAVKP